jgi:hypothetical protein
VMLQRQVFVYDLCNDVMIRSGYTVSNDRNKQGVERYLEGSVVTLFEVLSLR